MGNLKKVGLYTGFLGALASVGTLVLPEKAASQSTSGHNSPIISGNGNSITYENGFPTLETVRAQGPQISDEQYNSIRVGMTYPEVLSIVKVPGKETATNGRAQVYTWGTEVYINMMVTFVDGRVFSKSH